MRNSGKELESAFKKSLRRLPGYSKRLYDNGGKPTDETVLADFMYSSREGEFVFECKSTEGPSIAYRDFGKKGSGIHAEQIAEMRKWELARQDHTAYLALEYKRTGTLVLLKLEPAIAFFKSKKSINEKEARDMGWAQKPSPDGGWFLRL